MILSDNEIRMLGEQERDMTSGKVPHVISDGQRLAIEQGGIMRTASDLANDLTQGKARKSFGPNVSHQQALHFGCRADGFHVGVRHRDDKVRRVAVKLVKLGLFSYIRHKRYGDGMTYHTTSKGREVLAAMEMKEAI